MLTIEIKLIPTAVLKANSKEKGSIQEAFKPGQLPNLSYDKKLIDLKKSKKLLKTLSPLY